MFYLKEFSKVMKENLILGLIFILSTVSIVSLSFNQQKVEGFFSLSKKTQNYPYFNALLTTTNDISSVVRKIKNLPGVMGVKLASNLNLDSEIQALQSKFGEAFLGAFTGAKYQQLKVELKTGINDKNQSLIREYLSRLVGKSSITLSSTRSPRVVKIKKNDPLISFLNFGDIYLLSIMGGLWLLSMVLLLKPIKNKAYIIEKFQRRSLTDLKIKLTGLTLIAVPALLVNIYASQKIEIMGIMSVVGLILITLLFSGKPLKRFTIRS